MYTIDLRTANYPALILEFSERMLLPVLTAELEVTSRCRNARGEVASLNWASNRHDTKGMHAAAHPPVSKAGIEKASFGKQQSVQSHDHYLRYSIGSSPLVFTT